MKFKWRFWTGWTFAAVVLTWCILAYIFMWPPIVTYYDPHAHGWKPNSSCINNLREIDAAVNQWTVEHGKQSGDPVTLQDITPYIRLTADGKIPPCPQGGIYSVTVVGAEPTCSFGTNDPQKKIRIGFFHYAQNLPAHVLP